MAKELLVGLLQGALIGLLLKSLNLGFFGTTALLFSAWFFGASAFLGFVPILVANAICAFFTIKSLKKNPTSTLLGLAVGFVLASI